MARLLIEKGYRDVWPLQGGFDGWVELGYPTEPVAARRARVDIDHAQQVLRRKPYVRITADSSLREAAAIQLLPAERLYD